MRAYLPPERHAEIEKIIHGTDAQLRRRKGKPHQRRDIAEVSFTDGDAHFARLGSSFRDIVWHRLFKALSAHRENLVLAARRGADRSPEHATGTGCRNAAECGRRPTDASGIAPGKRVGFPYRRP